VGFVEVILITAGVVGELTGVNVDDVVGECADEIDVVADENQGALELIERVGKGVNARHV